MNSNDGHVHSPHKVAEGHGHLHRAGMFAVGRGDTRPHRSTHLRGAAAVALRLLRAAREGIHNARRAPGRLERRGDRVQRLSAEHGSFR